MVCKLYLSKLLLKNKKVAWEVAVITSSGHSSFQSFKAPGYSDLALG